MLKVLLAAGALVGGFWMVAGWCEDLMISRWLHHRLRTARSLHLSGLNLGRKTWLDPGAARTDPVTKIRFRALVREPVYGLHVEVRRWNVLTEVWRVGCVNLLTGERAVQAWHAGAIPELCEEVAEAF